MDYGIFDVRTDVNACDCTRGCADTVRESAMKVDPGRKIPCREPVSAACRSDALPVELHPYPSHRMLLLLLLFFFFFLSPEGRPGISDVSRLFGIAGLLFDSTLLSTLLVFCLVLLLSLSCLFLPAGPFFWTFPENSSIFFVKR